MLTCCCFFPNACEYSYACRRSSKREPAAHATMVVAGVEEDAAGVEVGDEAEGAGAIRRLDDNRMIGQ